MRETQGMTRTEMATRALGRAASAGDLNAIRLLLDYNPDVKVRQTYHNVYLKCLFHENTFWHGEYELRKRNPLATDNYLISIFSAGGYLYLEPRTLQVLCYSCAVTVRDKLSEYFLKRQAPNRTRPKPEFRESCSWVLFGRGTFELAWIWFIQTMKFEATYEHNVAAWMESPHAEELISQCGDPFLNTFKIYSFQVQTKSRREIRI